MLLALVAHDLALFAGIGAGTTDATELEAPARRSRLLAMVKTPQYQA